jgi:hypothetical protein
MACSRLGRLSHGVELLRGEIVKKYHDDRIVAVFYAGMLSDFF